MIAIPINSWLYSVLPIVKAHNLIFRALLLATVLAPSALWALCGQVGVHSRLVGHPQFGPGRATRVAGPTTLAGPVVLQGSAARLSRTGLSTDRLLSSMPRHHAPSPRFHRIRGKKISLQRAIAPTRRCHARESFLPSLVSVMQQVADGPNPSRGPPSQLFL